MSRIRRLEDRARVAPHHGHVVPHLPHDRATTLLERAQPARESSWAGGGILSPLYPWRYPDAVSELARWSQRYYPQFCQQLLQVSGIDPQWTQSGLLVLDAGCFDKAMGWAKSYGLACKMLDKRALHEQEPELASHYEQGLLFPEVAQIRNPRLIKSLHKSCLNRSKTN